jgi:hypothetical protein
MANWVLLSRTNRRRYSKNTYNTYITLYALYGSKNSHKSVKSVSSVAQKSEQSEPKNLNDLTWFKKIINPHITPNFHNPSPIIPKMLIFKKTKTLNLLIIKYLPKTTMLKSNI